MFDQAFFEDLRGVISDLFVGAEKVYIERQKQLDPSSGAFTAKSPAGAAVEAVVTRVAKELVDGSNILRTDQMFLVPAQLLSFRPEAGDLIRLGEETNSEPATRILVVDEIRSVSTFIVYGLVARI